MGDVGETFNALREHGKKKKASNLKRSTDMLIRHGVKFDAKNSGNHLIVSGKQGLIDFWPSTGKFIARSGKKGRGVVNLIGLCEVNDDRL